MALHLIGTHAVGTSPVSNILSFVEILKNTIANGRVGVNDVAIGFLFFARDVVSNFRHQRYLFFAISFTFCDRHLFQSSDLLVVWRLCIS
jgi:hypothetical protein